MQRPKALLAHLQWAKFIAIYRVAKVPLSIRLEKISVATFFQDANVRAERKRHAVLQNEALLDAPAKSRNN
jgi:hypothetical protein